MSTPGANVLSELAAAAFPTFGEQTARIALMHLEIFPRF